MKASELKPCGECGMPVEANEFHPYGACLMYKACHDSTQVKANLMQIVGEGRLGAQKEAAAPNPPLVDELRALLRRMCVEPENYRESVRQWRTCAADWVDELEAIIERLQK